MSACFILRDCFLKDPVPQEKPTLYMPSMV